MSEEIFEYVAELQARLDADAALAAAFNELTFGRRKEYHFHIARAKKAETRTKRVADAIPKILAGQGLRDAWANKRPKLVPDADGVVRLSGGNPQIAKGDGRDPVEAYVSAMAGWKQTVGRRLDELILAEVPAVEMAVRWNSPFYGTTEHGWFASFHCFDAYVKVTFLNGAHLDPPLPIAAKDPDAAYLHITQADAIGDADFARQFRSWVAHAARLPAWNGF